MNSKFGLEERFDVELKKSNPVDGLTIEGVMEVVHKREGEILSIDKGSNVITNTGKAELVRLMGSPIIDTVLPSNESQPAPFHWIGIGRRGDQPASATDTMLGGSLTNSFVKGNLDEETNLENQSPPGYYVSPDGTKGYEYNGAFVQDVIKTVTPLVAPRSAGEAIGGTATTLTGATNNFYHEHAPAGTNIAYDTFLWYAKFVFGAIAVAPNIYVPPDSGVTVVINEAGIFNRTHVFSDEDSDPMPVMLARRTFSDKPVKNDDELTIKWQITIK